MTFLASVQTSADAAPITGGYLLAALGFVAAFGLFAVAVLTVTAARRRRRMVPATRYRDISHVHVVEKERTRT